MVTALKYPFTKPPGPIMDGKQMASCRRQIGWSRTQLADHLGYPEARVRRMEGGAVDVPDELADWLEFHASHFRARPTPKGWKKIGVRPIL